MHERERHFSINYRAAKEKCFHVTLKFETGAYFQWKLHFVHIGFVCFYWKTIGSTLFRANYRHFNVRYIFCLLLLRLWMICMCYSGGFIVVAITSRSAWDLLINCYAFCWPTLTGFICDWMHKTARIILVFCNFWRLVFALRITHYITHIATISLVFFLCVKCNAVYGISLFNLHSQL